MAQLWEGFTGRNGSGLKRHHAYIFYTVLDKAHVLGWPPTRRGYKGPCYTERLEV